MKVKTYGISLLIFLNRNTIHILFSIPFLTSNDSLSFVYDVFANSFAMIFIYAIHFGYERKKKETTQRDR